MSFGNIKTFDSSKSLSCKIRKAENGKISHKSFEKKVLCYLKGSRIIIGELFGPEIIPTQDFYVEVNNFELSYTTFDIQGDYYAYS